MSLPQLASLLRCAGLAIVVPALIAAPPAFADDTDDSAVAGPVAVGSVAPVESGGAVAGACRQFGAALNLAAQNYEDFAYATAGNGNVVNYDDPTVWRSNVIGRTALREAAAAALQASHTPGLPPEVSDPMQTWSLHATKLLLVMGLRGGGDSLNTSATQLNSDAHAAQMACALNGGRA